MSHETTDRSLKIFFTIAFLIPIITTIMVILTEGLQTGLVTTQISGAAIVVIMSMVHAPTIAAVVVVFRDEGFDGIRKLFQQLRYWNFSLKWYLLALLIFPVAILAGLSIMTLFSPRYAPLFSISIVAIGTIFSPLWEEIGWTGYATPRMLKMYNPLKTGVQTVR